MLAVQHARPLAGPAAQPAARLQRRGVDAVGAGVGLLTARGRAGVAAAATGDLVAGSRLRHSADDDQH